MSATSITAGNTAVPLFNWDTNYFKFKFGPEPEIIDGVKPTDSCLYTCAVNNEIITVIRAKAFINDSPEVNVVGVFMDKGRRGDCICSMYKFKASLDELEKAGGAGDLISTRAHATGQLTMKNRDDVYLKSVDGTSFTIKATSTSVQGMGAQPRR